MSLGRNPTGYCATEWTIAKGRAALGFFFSVAVVVRLGVKRDRHLLWRDRWTRRRYSRGVAATNLSGRKRVERYGVEGQ